MDAYAGIGNKQVSFMPDRIGKQISFTPGEFHSSFEEARSKIDFSQHKSVALPRQVYARFLIVTWSWCLKHASTPGVAD